MGRGNRTCFFSGLVVLAFLFASRILSGNQTECKQVSNDPEQLLSKLAAHDRGAEEATINSCDWSQKQTEKLKREKIDLEQQVHTLQAQLGLGVLPPIYRNEMPQSTRSSFESVCGNFRDKVPYKQRLVGIAGLFNTGTNLLATLLSRNCKFHDAKNQPGEGSMSDRGPVLWQIPSGKHNHAHQLGKFFVSQDQIKNWKPKHGGRVALKYEHMITVVVVKDPLNWMSSMCRHKYAATGSWWREPKCPMLTSNSDVRVKWHKELQTSEFNTMLDFWVEWHNEYLDIDRPRIFVRYEDLLFDQERALRSVCACAGGELQGNLSYVKRSVKDGVEGHGTNNKLHTTRDSALQMYSSSEQRLKRYNDEDLEFIRDHKDANLLMEKLGYFVPELHIATNDRGEHKPVPYPGDWCARKDPNMIWCQG